MPSVGTLAPNISYYVNNNCGVAAVGGTMVTTNAITGFPKATFIDPGLVTPNPTSLTVGADGSAGGPEASIYWAVGDTEDLYTVETFDASGDPIRRFQNYPIIESNSGSGGSTITVSTNYPNYACNEQFLFWNRGTSFDNTTLPIGTTQIADTWFFSRGNLDATIAVAKYDFPAGANLARSTPASACRYTVTTASADGVQDFEQFLGDVQSLNGESVALAFEAQTLSVGSTATLTMFVRQNFGTGGSPTVDTAVGTLNVTDSMTYFPFTVTVPSISGLTIGTGGDDTISIILRANPNQIQDLIFTNAQFQNAPGTGINYPYLAPKEQQAKILNNQLLGPDEPIGASLVGYTDTETVRDALDNVPEKNFLIGWDFRKNPRQLGATNTPSTFGVNNNDTIIMDQTWLLSDGNDIVTIDEGDQNACRMTVVAPATKFGIFQKITAEDSQSIIYNAKCSLRAALAMTSASSNIKIAVVGSPGTADQQGTDIIDAWNGEDTVPTLSGSWAYLTDPDGNTFGQITGTQGGAGVFVDVLFEDLTVPAGTVNLGVFIWSDTLNLVAADQVQVLYGQLNIGNNASPIQELTEGETLALCQQFIFKTYSGTDTPLSPFPNTNSPQLNDPVMGIDEGGSGYDHALRTVSYTYTFPVPLFKQSPARVATIYNPFTSATSSVRTDGSYSAGGSTTNFSRDLAATISHISEQYAVFKKGSDILATGQGFDITNSDSPCYFQLIVFSTVG